MERRRQSTSEEARNAIIADYKVEKYLPRREDEDDTNYQRRTMLHQDAELSVARVGLVRSRLEFGAGVKLPNLKWRELTSLTNYYLSNSSRNNDPLIGFTKKFGEAGLKAFLACEYGLDSGDQIIEMGEKLEPEIAQKVFDKYSEIVNLSDSIVTEIEAKFQKQARPEAITKIKTNLLLKAKELLNDFYNQAGKNIQPEDILRELNDINADIVLFAATFKNLSESGESVELATIAETRIETKKSSDLLPGEVETLKRIFLKNWNEKYPEKLSQAIFHDFEEILEGDSEFYILKSNNEIVAFLRSTEIAAGTLEIGSFNLRSEAMKTKIGEAFVGETVDRLAQSNVLRCSVYVGAQPLINYYEKFGFTVVGRTPPPPGEISLFYDMERNDQAEQQLVA